MAISSGGGSVIVSTGYNIARDRTSPLNPVKVEDGFNTAVLFSSIGSGAAAFNEIYCDIRTLAISTSETLDLYGSLLNPLGETINFARIKCIVVELLTTTAAASITVGNAASNPWLGPLGGTTPTMQVRNGGAWASTCSDATGWPVANGSTDNLKILNDSASAVATYRLTLIGAKT
jgi:hypothetical protein